MEGICTVCGQPCEVVVVDFGIGRYEYWGSFGMDTQLEDVSECCEAPVIDKKTGKIITLEDLEQNNNIDLI